MLFNKFNEIARSLDLYSDLAKRGDTATPIEVAIGGSALVMRGIYKESPRFYLPDATQMVNGKRLDRQLQEMMRLPFDTVAVLSESTIRGSDAPSMKMTLAIDLKGEGQTPQMFAEMLAPRLAAYPPYVNGWVLFSMMSDPRLKAVRPETGGWGPSPLAFGFCLFPEDSDGFYLGTAPWVDVGQTNEEIVADLKDDMVTIQNLCAMLSLSNVSTTKVTPPAALAKKRVKRGHLPLTDYHILLVDGERWDQDTTRGSGTGNSVRSHLRRGHIRRLSSGLSVWVRATVVKGQTPGFVEKDYELRIKHPNREGK